MFGLKGNSTPRTGGTSEVNSITVFITLWVLQVCRHPSLCNVFYRRIVDIETVLLWYLMIHLQRNKEKKVPQQGLSIILSNQFMICETFLSLYQRAGRHFLTPGVQTEEKGWINALTLVQSPASWAATSVSHEVLAPMSVETSSLFSRSHLITSLPVRMDTVERRNAPPDSCQRLGWLYNNGCLGFSVTGMKRCTQSQRKPEGFQSSLLCSQAASASVDPRCTECRNKLLSSKNASRLSPAFDQRGRAGASRHPPPCAKTQRLYWFWIMLCVSSSCIHA